MIADSPGLECMLLFLYGESAFAFVNQAHLKALSWVKLWGSCLTGAVRAVLGKDKACGSKYPIKPTRLNKPQRTNHRHNNF